MKSLIQKLVEIVSPSGFESTIREAVRLEIAPLADEMSVDPMGNLIARMGPPTGYTIMLAAHVDEIGLMVTHVDENGFARFVPIGGVSSRTCIGGRVRFLNGAAGVIGVERQADASKLPAIDQLYIDLGVDSRKDCPVRTGDVAAFDRPFLDLGKRLVSKAMDDRIGAAVLVETMRRVKPLAATLPHQLVFVFSVQEEVGLRGATTAAFGIHPDLGLAVDVTDCGDTPKGIKMDVSLGKGPAIKVRDSFMISDPRVVRWMIGAAEKAHLPYQLEVLERGGTDASAIQLSQAGAPAGCLSIPSRYIHSPSEMVDYDDVQNAVHLLAALLTQSVDLKQYE